jgi:hypothetical protein
MGEDFKKQHVPYALGRTMLNMQPYTKMSENEDICRRTVMQQRQRRNCQLKGRKLNYSA